MLKFELTEEHVAVLGRALDQMPYAVAAPVVAEMQRQINAQLSTTPAPAKDA